MHSTIEILQRILDLILLFFIWKVCNEKKQLQQNVEMLQQQLIEALNKDVKNQDNFRTDPVE